MKLLFILTDGNQTTFYHYSQKENTLLRIPPDFLIEKVKIGDLYSDLSFFIFKNKINQLDTLHFDNYLILGKKSVVDFLLEKNNSVNVTNPSTFSYKDYFFKKGKLTLHHDELLAFGSFKDDPNSFVRQEHLLRLASKKLIQDKNIFLIKKEFQRLWPSIETDITIAKMMKLVSNYVFRKKTTIRKKVISY